jgi:hypothetical protein
MQEMDLITRQRAAELTMNSKAKSDKDKVYEMVHYLEVFCRRRAW